MNNNIEWKMVKLGDVLRIGNGKDYKHLQSGDIPVYGTGGYMCSVNDYLYEGETVCIGRKGTIDVPQFHSGKIWTVDTLFYTHSFNGVFPKYVFYAFCMIDWKSKNEATGVPSLSKSIIEKVLIPIPYKNGSPDLETQELIAKKLGDMDSLIASKEKLLAKKRNLKTAAMQKLIKDEESTTIKLGKIAKIRTGSLDANEQSASGKYAFFTCGEEVYKTTNYAFDCDAVLLGGNNATGDFKIHRYKGKFNAYQRVYVISGLQKEILDCIYYVITKWLIDLKQDSTGSTTKFLKKKQIEDILITSDFTEQKRIATILSDMDSEISSIENEIAKLRNLKTAMMQKMFQFEEVVE